MGLIQRADVRAPVLRKETVTVDSIGGDVVVRGLLGSERIRLHGLQEAVVRRAGGDDDAHVQAGASAIPAALEKTVLAGDGKPLWTAAQWDEFASEHLDDALHLFSVVMRLSGGTVEEAAKN